MNNEFHGPGHLFCAGCKLDREALAAASWAGFYTAKGDHANALMWSQKAHEMDGELLTRSSMIGARGDLRVMRVGPRPTAEDVHWLIESLKITHQAFVRIEEIEKEMADKAAAASPAIVPEPEGGKGAGNG